MSPTQREKIEQAITGTFMWSFKRGDNIIYNYEIVWELYRAKRFITDVRTKQLYNKPILLILASIIECIMDDFSVRIIDHVRDIVPNMSQDVIDDFKLKKRDKFDHYIMAARKHNLFDANNYFYDELVFAKNSRNRFHIQNTYGTAPADEYNLFTDQSLRRMELVFEYFLRKMITKYYRGSGPSIMPAEVPYPWK